ncbi:MAG: OmpH family outer membrane protein [Flavobacteriales bacterium]
MRKIFIIGFALLVAVACTETKKQSTKSIPKVEAKDLQGLKIAYYSNDSIKKYFDYFKREEARAEKKQRAFEAQLNQKNKAYEDFVIKKEQEARAGLLSQNELAMVQQKAQQMQSDLMRYQQEEGQKIEKATLKSLQDINKKVETWGKKYCELHKIDLLLIQGEGGQINYINKNMDVTKAFINFLNENQKEIEKDLQ